MSLPQHFNRVNKQKQEESLSELNYYSYSYNFERTQEYIDYIKEEFDKDNFVMDDLSGLKEFAAKDRIEADRKIKKWFDSFIESNKIKSYEIKNCDEMSIWEAGEKKGITNILTFNK